ncbi:PocR ligand-binding domain-containing protein [bacterium]|nr:PocR ligand-binding domain-containing protein [bacterium]
MAEGISEVQKKIKIADVIDLDFVQECLDTFSRATGLACLMFDDDGPITKENFRNEFCCLTKNTLQGKSICEETSSKCGEKSAKLGEPVIYTCKAGLVSFGVPIIVDGDPIAFILAGQILTHKPEPEFFRKLAKDIGVDEDKYLESVNKLKILPIEQVKASADLLFIVANSLSKMIQKNYDLIEKNKMEEKSLKNEKVLRKIIEAYVKGNEYNDILGTIICETSKLFNADRGIFVSFDSSEGSNSIQDLKEYLASPDIDSALNVLSPQMALNFVIGHLKQENILYGNTVEAKERLEADFYDVLIKNMGVKTYLVAPICYANTYYGLIILHYTKSYKKFSESEISLIKSISRQSAVVIYQTKLYESIKRNEEYISNILNNIKDAVIIIDENCIIKSCNPAMESIWGYKPSDCIGQSLEFLLIPGTYIDKQNIMKYKETSKAKRKNGSIFNAEMSASSVVVNSKKYILFVVRDITERKKIEKMKNEFVSTVSHELRTPLTSIRGSIGLIMSEKVGKVPEKINSLLNIANNNCLRLIDIINDILDIEKIEAGKMDFTFAKFDLVLLIKQAITFNLPYAKKYNVEIKLKEAETVANVRVDDSRLIQVITNLLSNAVKFSEKNGTVEVKVERLNGKFRVSITNSGEEIPDEFKSRIFEKFAQADSSDSRQKGGTGLGLSISKAIMDQLGGKINFISEENKTTFYFELPEVLD